MSSRPFVAGCFLGIAAGFVGGWLASSRMEAPGPDAPREAPPPSAEGRGLAGAPRLQERARPAKPLPLATLGAAMEMARSQDGGTLPNRPRLAFENQASDLDPDRVEQLVEHISRCADQAPTLVDCASGPCVLAFSAQEHLEDSLDACLEAFGGLRYTDSAGVLPVECPDGSVEDVLMITVRDFHKADRPKDMGEAVGGTVEDMIRFDRFVAEWPCR